jgi:spermidine synthase
VVIAFLSGLTSLATQVAWTRVLTLIVGSTTYAFSSILLVYLAALGVGSAWASRRGARVPDVRADLAVAHLLMAVLMVGALYTVNSLPRWYLALYTAWGPRTIAGIVALNVTIVFGVLFSPLLCAGTILPLALTGTLASDPRGAGTAVGRIYAVNTAGAIAGSILGGFLLIPVLGAQITLLGIAGLAALTGGVLALSADRPRWLTGVAVAAGGVVALAMLTRPQWNVLDLHAGVFEPGRLTDPGSGTLSDPGARVLFHREGRTASVLVVERADGSRHLVINGRTNASTNPPDMATQLLLAQLPLLLAPRPEEVFIVGWGSGVTAGAATQSPAKRVTAVELEPAVVDASALFDHLNHRPRSDPRVRLYDDDARHLLLASDDSYDVIISEPPHPWVTGVANLFTQDFYRLVARRLHADGVVAQWLQSYQISFESYRSVVASFHAVLPEVMICNPPGGSDTILLGSRRPLAFDLDALHARWANETVRDELARASTPSPEHLLAGCYVGPDGVRAMVRGARLNPDDNMNVEFAAPRDIVRSPTETVKEIAAGLKPHAVPPERLLVDSSALFAHPERVRALIDGLRLHGRATARYEHLLDPSDRH